MDNEVFLSGKTAEAQERITKAIYARYAAEAFGKKAAEAQKRIFDLTEGGYDEKGNFVKGALDQARENMNSAYAKIPTGAVGSSDAAGFAAGNAAEKYQQAKAIFDKVTEDVEAAKKQVNGFIDRQQEFLAKLNGTMAADVNNLEKYKSQLTTLQQELDKMALPKGIDANTPASMVDKILGSDKEFQARYNAKKSQIESLQKLIDRLEPKTDRERAIGARADLEREFEAQKRAAELKYEMLKKDIEAEIAHDKTIMDNAERSYEDRLTAARKFYKGLEDIAEGERVKTVEIATARNEELTKKLLLDGKPGGTKLSPSERSSTHEAIQNAMLEMLNADQAFEDKRKEIAEKGANQVLAIQKDEVTKRLEMVKTLTENIDAQEEAAKQSLVNNLAAGVITYKKYTREKELLEADFAKKKSEAVVQYLKTELEGLESEGINVRALVDKLNEYLNKLQKDTNQQTEDKFKKKKNPILSALGLDEEQFSALEQVAGEAISVVQNIAKAIDQRYQSEISYLEQKKALIQQNAQDEINVINKAFLSEKQKTEKISEINAKAAGEKEKIDAKERELKRKMAINDKIASTTQIIEGTAVGIVNAWKLPPPFDAILAGLVAAAGAVQLATVMSAPIPAYKEGIGIKGRGKHPGGIALVGEGGAPELVIDRGTARVIDKPTLIDLSKEGRVIPQHKLQENIYNIVHSQRVHGSAGERVKVVQDSTRVVEALQKVEQAISSIPQTTYNQTPWGSVEKVVIGANRRIAFAGRMVG